MKRLIAHRPSKKFMETAYTAQSWSPTERNGWIIKFSIYNDDHIMLVFTSRYTGQTVIREFVSEDDAVDFINLVIELDPVDYHEF